MRTDNPPQKKAPMTGDADHVRQASGEQHAKLAHKNVAPAGLASSYEKSKARGSKVAGH